MLIIFYIILIKTVILFIVKFIYLLVSQKRGAVVLGDGSQIFPRRLTVGLQLLNFATYLVPVGFRAATNTAQVRMQICRVLTLLQNDRAQMLQQRMLVHSVFHFGHARQIVELKAFGVARVQKISDFSEHAYDILECLATLKLFHAQLQVHQMLGYFLETDI